MHKVKNTKKMSLKNLRKKNKRESGQVSAPKKVVKRTASHLVPVKTKDFPDEMRKRYTADLHSIATYCAMIRARVQYSLFDANFEAQGVNKRIERIISDSEFIFNHLTHYGKPDDPDSLHYEHVPAMLNATERIIYSPVEIIDQFNTVLEDPKETILTGVKKVIAKENSKNIPVLNFLNFLVDVSIVTPNNEEQVLAYDGEQLDFAEYCEAEGMFMPANKNTINPYKVTHWIRLKV